MAAMEAVATEVVAVVMEVCRVVYIPSFSFSKLFR